ncbi:unnamed protein product [Schistosoma curassoni]|uniref:HYPK_UBA domain-containing protein n=1 Tax=Schistosoma curassoni TaxID=6186 RepID=A0A183K559_9TREM|nr:unnamed protein product [Schistosoma curassoni]
MSQSERNGNNEVSPDSSVSSKHGEVISEVEEQRNTLVKHFDEPVNKSDKLNPPEIEASPTDFAMDATSPTIKEIRMAIRQIGSGKVAVTDNILVEALDSDIEVTANMLHILFKKI